MQHGYAAVGHLSMESKMRRGFGTSPAVRAALFKAYGLSRFGVFLRVALVLKMVRATQNSSSSQGGDVVSMGDIRRLYRDNGKENGDYYHVVQYLGFGVWVGDVVSRS